MSKKSRFRGCLDKKYGKDDQALAADEKYPVLNRDNLTITIQMQLSQKRKFFSEFFAAFLKSRLNFEHCDKKDDTHRFSIFEITDSEKVFK